MRVLHKEKISTAPDYAIALRARRQRLGLRQEDIAKRLGISTMGLSYFEKGSRIPKVSMLEEWANALGAEIWITIEGIEL